MKKIFLVVFAFFNFVLAQNTGTIKGIVKDSNSGTPLFGANIFLEKTSYGQTTDINGNFEFKNVPEGNYVLQVRYIGYAEYKDSIIVTKNKTITLSVELNAEVIEGESIIITGQALGQKQAINQQFMADQNAASALSRLPGVSLMQGENVDRLKKPDWNTEEYGSILENDFKSVLMSPLSTFSLDVDNASYSNVRRFIMDNRLPYKDAIRTEEMINYFDYDYEEPDGDHPLKANIEYADCPWNKDTKLIHIGIKAKVLEKQNEIPQNLVFLIDVSGSMSDDNKLPLLKKSFKLLVEQLDEKDKISIVVYAGNAGLVLPSTPGNEKSKILEVLERLESGGSTAGGAGIQLAYKVAAENFIKEGNNRVILATDGDFNVGISSTSELVDFVGKKKDEGIFITVLGFGMGNYKDDRLQEIADRGNGNHAYIDNILEAKKVLVNEINSTLFTIAKDVKLQIEFNPAKIKEYRLIGYENRLLNDEDFVDDTKDAGEVGYGHTVTAIYEVKPGKAASDKSFSELKYQEYKLRDDASDSDEILTVKFRYKKPDGNKSIEFSEVLDKDAEKFEDASDNLKFASAVAQFALLLRDSKHKGTANFNDIISTAKEAKGKDEYGYRAEFIQLVERAQLLKQTDEKK
ncbi:MAG: DUF3520 domain-containing protein [Ignavibacteria bacterium]|nr:DUF3520 domain-containing protein [Ignavibacteria bacterium]